MRHTLLTYLSFIIFCGLGSAIYAQGVSGWTLDAPPNSVELTGISGGPNSGVVVATFKNLSQNTIIEFRVSSPAHDMTGLDAFTVGNGSVAHLHTMVATFGGNEFVSNGKPDQRLTVNAIVYDDGTRIGSKDGLAFVEDEMIGAALECARISEIWAHIDRSSGTSGIGEGMQKIGQSLPATNAEASASVRGVTLSGVDNSYITRHLANPSFALRDGMSIARQVALGDAKVEEEKISASSAPAMRASGHGHPIPQKTVEHGPGSLADKYSALTQQQAHILHSYLRASNEK